MKKINLDVRDFALTTNALKFMQEAYGDLEKLVGALGDNYIVSGCVVTGASVSAGWMVLRGRIMPFVGGAIGSNVRIKTTTVTITVGAGSREETSYYAEFDTYSGDSNANITWSLIAKPTSNITLIDFDFGGSGELIGDINERTTRAGAKVTSSHVTMTIKTWNNSGAPAQVYVYPDAFSFKVVSNPVAPVVIKRGTAILWGILTNNGSSYVIKLIDNAPLAIGDVIYLENIHE